MSVTVDEIERAARAGAAALSGETAGYLMLAVLDTLGSRDGRLCSTSVALAEDGSVAAGALENTGSTLEADVRALLAELLVHGGKSVPALVRVASCDEPRGLPRLVGEIEAALIPVNRAAARRALARLHRDVTRAIASGKLAPRSAAAASAKPAPSVESVAVAAMPVSVEAVVVPVVVEAVAVPVVVEAVAAVLAPTAVPAPAADPAPTTLVVVSTTPAGEGTARAEPGASTPHRHPESPSSPLASEGRHLVESPTPRAFGTPPPVPTPALADLPLRDPEHTPALFRTETTETRLTPMRAPPEVFAGGWDEPEKTPFLGGWPGYAPVVTAMREPVPVVAMPAFEPAWADEDAEPDTERQPAVVIDETELEAPVGFLETTPVVEMVAETAAEPIFVEAPAEDAAEPIFVEAPAEEAAEPIFVEPPAEEAAEPILVKPPVDETVEPIFVDAPEEEAAESIFVEAFAEEASEPIFVEAPVDEAAESLFVEAPAELDGVAALAAPTIPAGDPNNAPTMPAADPGRAPEVSAADVPATAVVDSPREIPIATYRPRRSDVSELLAGFGVADALGLGDMSRELKRIADGSGTPCPPDVATGRPKKIATR